MNILDLAIKPIYSQVILVCFLCIILWQGLKVSIILGLSLWAIHTFMRYYYLLPKKNLKGEHVMITGGGNGIGRELAIQLAKVGTKISIAEINIAAANETKESLQRNGFQNIQVFQCDVSNNETVKNVFEQAVKNFGEIDILINNAGLITAKTLLENNEELMAKTIQVNTISNIYTTKAVLKSMINRNHGHIVSIASIGSYIHVPGLADYNASKYGVLGFHEALTQEISLQNSNVQTTCVCPWYVDTNFAKAVNGILGFRKMGTSEVVERIIMAIRQNEYITLIPFKINLLIIMKQFLPRVFYVAIMQLITNNLYQQVESARKRAMEQSQKQQ